VSHLDIQHLGSRDLVLYLGQRVCGAKLQRLAESAGMTEYSAVSIAIRRLDKRLNRRGRECEELNQLCQMLNVEM
jgi:hypothetical protein